MTIQSLVQHSFLNLFRNARRSAMILVIIGSGVFLLFLTNCYLMQMFRGMRMGYQHMTGFIQVAAKGYWDPERETEAILRRAEVEKLDSRIGALPHVTRINHELSFEGLIGTEHRGTVITGMGIQPEKQGGYAGYILVEDGTVLESTDTIAVMIGMPIAKRLAVRVGDYVNLMTSTTDGALNLASARIMSTVSTGLEQSDAFFTAVPLRFAQELRQTDGIERMLVFIDDEQRLEEVHAEIRNLLASEGYEFETRTWMDLNKFYFDLKGFYDGIFTFVIGIISLLVFLSVFEISSMSFFERFREIGTLRAIGNTRAEVFLILLGESVMFFIGGLLAGGLGGAVTAWFLNSLNLSWLPPGASRSVPFGFFIRPEFLVMPAGVVFAASLASAVLPAWKAASARIVEVLRYE